MPTKIEAYDYRGTLLVKLTSGLVLVHGPATAHSSKRPILAEASNLAAGDEHQHIPAVYAVKKGKK